jgi:hypothetical protein
MSSGQRTRHIDIRYFFITDQSKNHGINILHCPTDEMLADFFTKPLQGALFRKYRSVLLGHEHIRTLKRTTGLTEERVGNENPTSPTDTTASTGSKDASHTTSPPITIEIQNPQHLSSSHSLQKYPENK